MKQQLTPREAEKTKRIECGDTVTFDLPPRFTSGVYRYRSPDEKIVDGEIIETKLLE